MSESCAEIESFDDLDTTNLNRQGWHLMTHFHLHEGVDGSAALNYAVNKSQNHNRRGAIRNIVKDGIYVTQKSGFFENNQQKVVMIFCSPNFFIRSWFQSVNLIS